MVMDSFPSMIASPTHAHAHARTKSAESQIRIEELPSGDHVHVRSRSLANKATSPLRRANTVAQTGHALKRHLELKATREKTAIASGIRAKDSHEVLRNAAIQRSKTQAHRTPLEGRAAGRKVGHFTVGSVGQNGKIFLRPIANPPRKDLSASPSSSLDQVTSLRPQPQSHARERDDPSRWSSSQLSELRPRGHGNESDSVDSQEPRPESASFYRHRANSFSTISEQQSLSGAGNRGEFRIVIDRPEDRPRSAGENLGSAALEVPIPHYRLGSPRFNAEGSAILQSSLYTRTSMSDNFRNSTHLGGMTDVIPPHARSGYGRESFSHHRPSFAVSLFSGTGAIDLSRASPAPRNSIVHEFQGPVDAAIYETLVTDMDSDAVVRYVPGTKDISAATPARIVAQISSESFMDYELVSDFFLTFRSYLSPCHLLALLLARLEWAINRLQEDGRIIRIRTFAALRHWILNYFVDDFVVNYNLRSHFCATINALYTTVRSRISGGTSDLKILIDLKRCWNGKCSVYWSGTDLSRAYNDPDTPIAPGSVEIDLKSAGSLYATVPPLDSDPSPETRSRDSLPSSAHHERTDSAATAQSVPFSSKSETSIVALSCSLPPKSPRRMSIPYSKSKAPRPVPLHTTAPSENAPSSPKVPRHPFHGHAHKRSGSFSDSVRDDRVPVFGTEPGLVNHAPRELLDPVSFIRGGLYPPIESYMTMMAPDSPPLAAPSHASNQDRRSIPDAGARTGSSNSGVRTIIGSIKRVLHTRNGGQSVSGRVTNAADAISLPSRGRISAIPNHIALGSDFYREKKMAASPKRPARLDTLCEESLVQYRRALRLHDGQEEATPRPATSGALDGVAEVQTPEEPPANHLEVSEAERSKVESEITTGSGSIVIVDDTGFEFPSMSGALGDSESQSENHVEDGVIVLPSTPTRLSGDSIPKDDKCTVPVYYNDNGVEPNSHRPASPHPLSPVSVRRSSSVERQATPTKRMSLSLRLRKYASFQSGISKHRLSLASMTSKSHGGSMFAQEHSGMSLGPSLRRRPGGNLRQMQFIKEPESGVGRTSMASESSYGDSFAESGASINYAPEPLRTAPKPPKSRFSLISVGPNVDMQRSFEAAIAQFARIPDDDDGGIESTLLKLEGKWRGPSSGDMTPQSKVHERIPAGKETLVRVGWDLTSRRRQTERSAYSTVGGRLAPPRPYSESVADSEESYNSIPLLERGLTDDSMRRPVGRQYHNPETSYGSPLSLVSSRDTSELVSSHPSIQIVQKTDSIQRIAHGSTQPGSPPSLVIDKRQSVLSSDQSLDLVDTNESMGSRMSTDVRSISLSAVEIPPHPLAHPPSPPMTVQHPNSFGSSISPLEKIQFQPQPLTPDTSPRHGEQGETHPSARSLPQMSVNVLSNMEKTRPPQLDLNQGGVDHIPFVLACESQMLAQQLTLVEMAALSEVDWRDLVEMKWSSASPSITSWIEFLSTEQRKGIDMVAGRFNLMVKWVISEIVLTLDIHERARTIVKFIHTAAHARRMCNYVTMLQIAIALTSSDSSRLERTWSLVPHEDKRLFRDMESLIQPVRNFHDLRVEMETANLQEGCIPFIGLYIHDLTYNAQKPAQVRSHTGTLLVNFERYRTAARIVKSLLRLIDASTKYRFEPTHGIIERCLWIASLSDEEISRRSRALE
ncbi:Uncharacterized protein PECH_001281 [Penicillium ucsense]|uniref:Guanine nucleotide exchange factor n=1 Tax=Penicillium ucsense TaxID=2839758 RepID=A0A8J8WJJ5_9EURO|nr:Uncharacterized protein PECM_006614 [Penicillium ucsense]KAF7733022.1 Uncharacterized protein PECH_001281 [Penicillium ucsense]